MSTFLDLIKHNLQIYSPTVLIGALDKYNKIPNFFFQKSWDFYTIRIVGDGR